MTFKRFFPVAAAAALTFGAAPANALDELTGAYEGKLSCKGSADGVPLKAKQEITIALVEGKSPRFAITAGGVGFGGVSRLVVQDDATKPDRGRIAGIQCDLTVGGFTGITLQGDAIAKPGNEKATLKGTIHSFDFVLGQYATCTFTAKRTSTTAPKVGGCGDS